MTTSAGAAERAERWRRWTRYLAPARRSPQRRCRCRPKARWCASPASCSKPPASARRSARCAKCACRSQPPVLAEVVGFNGDRAFLMPTGEVHGLASGARVVPRPAPRIAPQLGQRQPPVAPQRRPRPAPADGRRACSAAWSMRTASRSTAAAPLHGELHDEPMIRRPINAMDRDPVRVPLDTGVRAINAMLTVGRGQRIGLFAGTGVGKSVLLGMMARYTAADVIVVALIGERGREVKEFVEDILGDEGLERSVVVAAPADAPPLTRLQGAAYATAIAEHFRDRGQHVLLLMDSLTRYAHGAARDRAGDRRAAGHQGLSAERVRQAAAARRAQRQRAQRLRLDHRVLHRAQRRRRSEGPDRRRGTRHPRRPHRAVARAGRGRPLSRRSTSSARSRA